MTFKYFQAPKYLISSTFWFLFQIQAISRISQARYERCHSNCRHVRSQHKLPNIDLVPGPTVTSSSQQWSASRELKTLTDQWWATDQWSATTGLHWHRTNKKTLMEFKHRSTLGQPSKLAAAKKVLYTELIQDFKVSKNKVMPCLSKATVLVTTADPVASNTAKSMDRQTDRQTDRQMQKLSMMHPLTGKPHEQISPRI